jgi:endonuclease/exonuclease/phosphatase family metal-dependent hydrolase
MPSIRPGPGHPSTSTDVATANVLCSLGRPDAAAALRGVLDLAPDIVGLQEWGPSRRRLLDDPRYAWTRQVYGDCVVGARLDRYDLVGWRSRALGWFARSDRGARPVPVLPPRVATVAVLHDRRLDRRVAVVCYHLVPGVQSHGRYRDDRPLLVARHRSEVRRLGRLVAERLALGDVVHAMGDSNLDGLRLPGLMSAWEGREDDPRGTLGSSRKIDDVLGPGPATALTLLRSASDHAAVVVRRADV